MSRFYVYVIKSGEVLKYTGMTEDLVLRLKQYNNKSVSFWTKSGTEWELVYIEGFYNKMAH